MFKTEREKTAKNLWARFVDKYSYEYGIFKRGEYIIQFNRSAIIAKIYLDDIEDIIEISTGELTDKRNRYKYKYKNNRWQFQNE